MVILLIYLINSLEVVILNNDLDQELDQGGPGTKNWLIYLVSFLEVVILNQELDRVVAFEKPFMRFPESAARPSLSSFRLRSPFIEGYFYEKRRNNFQNNDGIIGPYRDLSEWKNTRHLIVETQWSTTNFPRIYAIGNHRKSN